MDRAMTNAREQLGRRMAENSAQTQLLEGVAEAFGLDQPPRRIEVYDNSHIQGAHAVGAFIVAGPDGFEKAQYRKFNIKSEELAPGDDYAMMREVLSRRFARMVKEEAGASDQGPDTGKWKRPDLVLIDGGPGQLSVACQVFADLGVKMWRWWASPRAPTAMPGASISTFPAGNPSASIPRARFCIISSGCATKPTAS
jgi:excinuclease ABC subunit C